RLERQHEYGRLGGHVQARAEAQPPERLLLGEALADLAEDRHPLLRPLDLQPPLRRQPNILHVVLNHARARPFAKPPTVWVCHSSSGGFAAAIDVLWGEAGRS